MASAAPRTMAARRARVAAIIARRAVGSQEELGRLLAAEGIDVTQATLSRDLDAVGAVKEHDARGRARYTLRPDAAADTTVPAVDPALGRAVAELLIRAEAAGNIAVLHTPPGAAQFLAGKLDRSVSAGMVGSVAGDDTIIIVLRTAAQARELCAMLVRLAE